jgi:RNA-binding protein
VTIFINTVPKKRDMDIDDLKNTAKSLEPIVRIGKSGLTETVLAEIEKHLKKRKLIKIRFLKSSLENEEKQKYALLITDYTRSVVVSFVGSMLVLYKR